MSFEDDSPHVFVKLLMIRLHLSFSTTLYGIGTLHFSSKQSFASHFSIYQAYFWLKKRYDLRAKTNIEFFLHSKLLN